MKTLYIISKGYYPSTAQNNRIMAFIKGFSELGVNLKVYYLLPNKERSKVREEFPNVEFRYLWDYSALNNRFYILFRSILSLFRLIEKKSNIFITYIDLLLLPSFFWKKSNLFHERTEHPDEVRKSSIISDIKQRYYLNKCRSLKGLFVISKKLKKYFVSQGLNENNISVINMIVDNSRFKNLNKNKEVQRYIAYCGSISLNKDGVDVLIESFSKVVNKFTDLKLYIIGDFISKLDEKLILNKMSKLGIDNNVHFTGKVFYTDMPQLLKNAEALVLSRPNNKQAQYGFPTKLGEYLLTKNPVIVTRVGEIDLFLENDISALIVEAGNINDFAKKIEWVVDNQEKANKIGENGEKVALKEFNYIIEAKKIVDIIFTDKESI